MIFTIRIGRLLYLFACLGMSFYFYGWGAAAITFLCCLDLGLPRKNDPAYGEDQDGEL